MTRPMQCPETCSKCGFHGPVYAFVTRNEVRRCIHCHSTPKRQTFTHHTAQVIAKKKSRVVYGEA